mgnify:CR=1 FL=1
MARKKKKKVKNRDILSQINHMTDLTAQQKTTYVNMVINNVGTPEQVLQKAQSAQNTAVQQKNNKP